MKKLKTEDVLRLFELSMMFFAILIYFDQVVLGSIALIMAVCTALSELRIAEINFHKMAISPPTIQIEGDTYQWLSNVETKGKHQDQSLAEIVSSYMNDGWKIKVLLGGSDYKGNIHHLRTMKSVWGKLSGGNTTKTPTGPNLRKSIPLPREKYKLSSIKNTKANTLTK